MKLHELIEDRPISEWVNVHYTRNNLATSGPVRWILETIDDCEITDFTYNKHGILLITV